MNTFSFYPSHRHLPFSVSQKSTCTSCGSILHLSSSISQFFLPLVFAKESSTIYSLLVPPKNRLNPASLCATVMVGLLGMISSFVVPTSIRMTSTLCLCFLHLHSLHSLTSSSYNLHFAQRNWHLLSSFPTYALSHTLTFRWSDGLLGSIPSFIVLMSI